MMTPQEPSPHLTEFVRQFPIFAKLNWLDQQKIARKAIIQEYRKGDIVVREGTPPDFFYCLLSGRVHSYLLNADGEKVDTEFFHRGNFFGVISVFTGETHSRNYQALNDSLVLKIAEKDFHDLLDEIPHLGVEFSKVLSQNIRRRVKGSQQVFESQIVSVYSPIGGTGSSTYALNLAISLHKQTHKKVIFVHIDSEADLKNQAKVSAIQWNQPAIGLTSISDDPERFSEQISKGELSVDVLNVCLESSVSDGNSLVVPVESVRKKISVMISALVGSYHYVVVDLPNESNEAVMEALIQSDIIHLLVQDREEDLASMRLLIDRLKGLKKDAFQDEKLFILIRPVEDKMYLSFEEINRALDCEVYKILPFTGIEEFRTISTASLAFIAPNENSFYHKTVVQISREIGRVLVGLVLGGGAALGVAHVGVIRALEKEKIPVDVIVGSSMGALIGALWAVGYNCDELEAIAREFENKSSLWKLFDPVPPVSALIDGGLISRWLRKHLGSRTFYSCRIPLRIISYDLKNRQELVLESGSLVDAVRQSVSIPGVVRPVMKKDQMIIDGGVLNPLPTNVLVARGVKKVIAVNVLQSPEQVSRGQLLKQAFVRNKLKIKFWSAPWEYVRFRFWLWLAKSVDPNIADIIVKTLQASEYVIAEQSAHQADVVIHPDLTGIDWFELYRVDELIKAGETATVKALSKIRHLVEN